MLLTAEDHNNFDLRAPKKGNPSILQGTVIEKATKKNHNYNLSWLI